MPTTNPSNDVGWNAVLETVEFARTCVGQWAAAGKISRGQAEDIGGAFAAHGEQLWQQAAANASPPAIAGLIPPQPNETPSLREFRYWTYVEHELRQPRLAGKLTLSQSHALLGEARERLTALRRRLAQEGVAVEAVLAEASMVATPWPSITSNGATNSEADPNDAVRPASGLQLATEADSRKKAVFSATNEQHHQSGMDDPKPSAPPRRNILEILLEPRSIQWLLGLGGALMVVGLVILLWINEFFTPPVMAVSMGAAKVAVLALTSLIVHIVHATAMRDQQFTPSLPAFGLLFGVLSVLLGTIVYFQHLGPRTVWADQPPQWSYVGAMLLAAVASQTGAHVYRHSARWLPTVYFFATGAATMVAAVAALAALGLERWQEHAPILMLIPIAYIVAARLYGDCRSAEPLAWVAHVATMVMLASSLSSAFEGFTRIVERQPLNLALAAFFAEAAEFYGLAMAFRKQPWCAYLAALMVGCAMWQVLTYVGVATETYILTFAIIGFVLLVGNRLSLWEETAAAPLADAAFQAANALLSLAFVSSVVHNLGRINSDVVNWSSLAMTPIERSFFGSCVTMFVISLFSVAITQHAAWRRWYVVTAVAEGAVTLLALHKLIALSPWEQVELFSVIVGLVLLIVGHVGWYCEQDRESELVSMSLLFGALLASIPLAIATWIDRGHDEFRIANEFGFLFVSVLLLATGMIFQLKATTLVGSTMMSLYFATLLLFVPWSRLNSVATAITIGGGVIFGSGLALAFCRDRVLALPDRIKQREGLFRVLNWR